MNRASLHTVPETVLTVVIAMKGLVPVQDSSQGPHPSLLQPPEVRLGGVPSCKGVLFKFIRVIYTIAIIM